MEITTIRDGRKVVAYEYKDVYIERGTTGNKTTFTFYVCTRTERQASTAFSLKQAVTRIDNYFKWGHRAYNVGPSIYESFGGNVVLVDWVQ